MGHAGTFPAVAFYGGVAQPPGYPLATLYSSAFVWLLPVSSVGWRVAVSSAVAGALACGLVALLVSRGGAALIGEFAAKWPLKLKEEALIRLVCGYVAGMAFGLNGCFWGLAVRGDVRPVSMLMLCLVLCFLVRWSYNPYRWRYLALGTFAYGLTLTNSQILLAAAPALPFFVSGVNHKIGRDLFLTGTSLFGVGLVGALVGWLPWLRDSDGRFTIFILVGLSTATAAARLAVKTRGAFTEWKVILVCAGLLLLGLALYFYLPIASMTNPPVNWGYPRTVGGFFHVLSRGQYERLNMVSDLALFLDQLGMYATLTARQFGWPFLLAAAIPIGFVRRMVPRERATVGGLLVLLVSLIGLTLAVLNPAGHGEVEFVKAYFCASYVVLSILTGYGLVMVAAWVAGTSRAPF